MFNGYDSAFGLLGIRTYGGGGFYGSGGGSGGTGYMSNLTGWADKGNDENSSIGLHQQQTIAGQIENKTREAYEHDIRKQVTDQIQGDSQTPLTDEQKKERDQRVEDLMKQYRQDQQLQNEARNYYRPELSSNERNNQRIGEDTTFMDNLRDAVNDYVRENKTSPSDAGTQSAPSQDPLQRYRDYEAQNGGIYGNDNRDNEDKPTTQDKAAEAEARANSDSNNSQQQQVNDLRSISDIHTQQILELYTLLGC